VKAKIAKKKKKSIMKKKYLKKNKHILLDQQKYSTTKNGTAKIKTKHIKISKKLTTHTKRQTI
jgi:hypothetical protein